MSWFRRYSALLFPVLFLFFLNSCAGYVMKDQSMDGALEKGTDVVQVLWDGQKFELLSAYTENETLKGFLFEHRGWDSNPNDFQSNEEYNAIANYGNSENDNMEVGSAFVGTSSVHIVVSSKFPLQTNHDSKYPLVVAIPFGEITKVQVREHSAGYSIAKSLGVAVMMAGLVGLVYAATKDSCPFIYVQDGDEFILCGEIYSGAIHPPLERHDYLALPLSGVGPCNLKITNEVFEIQHTNLTELMVFDHSPGQRVLLDRHGTALRIVDPLPPLRADTFSGEDVQALIKSQDEVLFLGGIEDDNESEEGLDGMILTFDRPVNSEYMKLMVNARNSTWMDHVLGMLFEEMGDMFKPWQEAQKTGSSEAMNQWSLEQGLPLKVSLKTPDGWQYVEYFDLAGPIAARDMAMGIDLKDFEGDKVTIKLECGYRFWEIDTVMADFSPDDHPYGTTVSLEQAVSKEGLNVTGLLVAEDDQYLHQPDVGDETILNFNLPDLAPGNIRSVILHSKGHYDILREPQGQPDAAFVTSFQQPGRVTEYSRYLYQYLSNKDGN